MSVVAVCLSVLLGCYSEVIATDIIIIIIIINDSILLWLLGKSSATVISLAFYFVLLSPFVFFW